MTEAERMDFVSFYEASGINWGAGDMFFIEAGSSVQRSAELARTLAAGADEKGHPLFSEVLVILPATVSAAAEEEFVPTGAVAPELISELRVVRTDTMSAASVVSAIEGARTRSAVIIAGAGGYRDNTAASAESGSSLKLPENMWVPHVHALAQAVLEVAVRKELYVALDVDEGWPFDVANQELLRSIDGFGVLTGNTPDVSAIVERIPDWDAMVHAGEIGRVLTEIDSLPALHDRKKPLLRLQMLSRAGLHSQVLQALQTETDFAGLNPMSALQVAQIANAAGAGHIAAEILSDVELNELPQEGLEVALTLAAEIGSGTLVARSEGLLSKHFPDSDALRQHKARELLANRNYGQLATLLEKGGSDTQKQLSLFYSALSDVLASEGNEANYQVLLDDLKTEFPEQRDLAKRLLSREAEAKDRHVEALRLILPETETEEITAGSASMILDRVEKLLLTDKVDEELLGKAIFSVIRYLSRRPGDGSVRVALIQVLSAQSMGLMGIALLVRIALDLAEQPLTLLQQPHIAERERSEDPERVLQPFMMDAMEWLGQISPVVIGRTTFPRERLTSSPDALLVGIQNLLESYEPLSTEADVRTIASILAIGTSITPHAKDTNADLTMVRMVAIRLMLAGWSQSARDYAEHCLNMTNDIPARARLAWLCFADVYERIRNPIEGLIGMTCALSASREVAPEQVWYESLVLFRLMRNLHMLDRAYAFVDRGRDALDAIGALERYSQRIDTLRLQGRLWEVSHAPDVSSAEIERLVSEVTENAKLVLERDDEPGPVAALLGQVLRFAELNGLRVPAATAAVLDELSNAVSPAMSSLLKATNAKSPEPEDVLAVIKQMEQARYVEDVAFDVHQVVIVAKRLLDSERAGRDPKVAAFAVEILTDHAVGLAAGQISWLPQTLDAPASMATDAADGHLSLVMLGLSERGELLRVTAQDGELKPPVREPESVFSVNSLRNWSSEFPYKYGIDTQTYNLFYSSTNQIGVTELPERSLLIMGAELQQFTPNLLRIEGEFAGENRRIAVAPSLAWLDSIRRDPPQGDGRSVAWIPTAASESQGQTLAMIADRLDATFADHAIAVNTGEDIPSNLEGADLVVVAAHGGVVSEGRYFQSIASDAQFKAMATELSDGLRNVGVSILFVCSGGRFDKHPAANTSLGLANEILNRGGGAVIASPWPLDARVPSYWLPAFLKAWDDGAAAIDAAFEANRSVWENFSKEPRDFLAMHVYGNPLQKKGSPSAS